MSGTMNAPQQFLPYTAVRPTLLPRGWIVAALFMLNPVWWALGFGDFAWCLAVFPLWMWIAQRRNLRFPPGTLAFTVFLAWALLTVVRLDRFTRVLAFGFRFSSYLTALGLAVYVYNERSVSRDRFIRWVAWFWIAAVLGGYIGLLVPNGRINTTLASVLLPKSISSNDFVGNLVRPGFAQVQNLFGISLPRPKTLFSFTNEWGGNVGLLTPFFAASFFYSPKLRERRFGLLMSAIAVPPMVISVNRGLWLTLILTFVLVAFRSFIQGRSTALKILTTTVGVVTVLLAVTPLGEVVLGRLSESDSNTRAGIYEEAWEGAKQSPIFGYGGPRPSKNPQSPSVGTHGQVWLVMFSHGFVGLALYGGWALLSIAYAFRPKDRVSIMLACTVVAGAMQMFFYNLLPTALPIVLTAVGLLARPDVSPTVTERVARAHG